MLGTWWLLGERQKGIKSNVGSLLLSAFNMSNLCSHLQTATLTSPLRTGDLLGGFCHPKPLKPAPAPRSFDVWSDSPQEAQVVAPVRWRGRSSRGPLPRVLRGARTVKRVLGVKEGSLGKRKQHPKIKQRRTIAYCHCKRSGLSRTLFYTIIFHLRE